MAKKNGKKAVSKYVTAYREMIDVMELLENNEPIEVKDDANEDEVKAEIVKAIAMIDKDEFSEDTSEIIEELTPPVKGKNGKKEVEDDADEDEVVSPEAQLKEAIEQAEDIGELRDLVEDNTEFKSLRSIIKTFKKMSLLKTAMVELLTDPPAEEVKAKGEEPTLEELINSVTDFAELVEMVEDNDAFKKLRKTVKTFKLTKPLKAAMLAELEVEKPVEKAGKPEKTAEEKAAARAQFTKTGPGRLFFMAQVMKDFPKLTEKESVEKADALYAKANNKTLNFKEQKSDYNRVKQVFEAIGM